MSSKQWYQYLQRYFSISSTCYIIMFYYTDILVKNQLIIIFQFLAFWNNFSRNPKFKGKLSYGKIILLMTFEKCSRIGHQHESIRLQHRCRPSRQQCLANTRPNPRLSPISDPRYEVYPPNPKFWFCLCSSPLVQVGVGAHIFESESARVLVRAWVRAHLRTVVHRTLVRNDQILKLLEFYINKNS